MPILAVFLTTRRDSGWSNYRANPRELQDSFAIPCHRMACDLQAATTAARCGEKAGVESLARGKMMQQSGNTAKPIVNDLPRLSAKAACGQTG